MGLAELSSTFFIKTAHYIKKIIVPSRRELKHGAKNSNLLTIKGIQMNQMTQNRFGGVPTAHPYHHNNPFSRKHLAALLLLLVMLGAGGKAWGQTYYWVNGAAQSGNRIPANTFWGNGGNATITIANGETVYVDGQIGIWSDDGAVRTVTIKPATAGGTCTIKRGTHTGFLFWVYSQDAVLPGVASKPGYLIIEEGVTIDGGYSDNRANYRSFIVVAGGARCDLNGVTLKNNFDFVAAGAVNNMGALYCDDCEFSNLKAVYGGAILNYSGTVSCTNCTFSGNRAAHGGAITNYSIASFSGCTFSGNYTTNITDHSPTPVTTNGTNGGAIENGGSGVLNTVSGTTFTGNYSAVNGGAIFNDSGASPLSTIFTSCDFIGNHAQVGGAIFNSTTMQITGTAASNTNFGDGTDGNKNYAWQGGAIYNNGSSLNLSYCTFNVNKTINSNNNGGEGGGAIFNRTGTTTCSHCNFTGNLAYRDNANNSNAHGLGFGGGILNRGTLSCSDNCTFTNNTAYVGGGICSYEKVTVTNCTFTSNTASGPGGGNGGGLYQANSSTSNPSVVTSCEFDGNSANAGGGIFSSGYLRITEASGSQTLIHNNGILSGGTGGGGILTNGTIDMEAGKIYNNATNIPNGGGVYVAVISHAGDFRLKGSSAIYSNTATGYGGGVYVESGATFTMSGSSNIGASGGNSATLGGGIYSEGTVSINGGLIANNTSSGSGGGVYVMNGICSITGGAIGSSGNANTATNDGGGLYIASDGTVYIDGGNIEYNTASGNGGGVYQGGTLYMEYEVHIENNTNSSAANNVYLPSGKLVTIDEAGLDCGSHTGINNNTDALQITNATGSAAVANAQKAFRNGFFFQDANSKSVATSSTGAFASNSSSLYLTSATIPQPCTFALANGATAGTDYILTSGRVSQVNTLAGLAFLAKDVYQGNNYNGLTVTLANDITIGASDNWEPIGYRAYSDDCNGGTNKPFKGTFNGQGHSIINLRGSNVGYQDGGLFGYVEGGTIKNVIVASGNGVPATENVGGIVGYLNGGSVYNCMSSVTPTGGTNRGALVGKIANSGSLYNSFANSSSPLVGNNAGTVANCYVRGASILVTTGTANYCYASSGSASGTNGTFSAVETTRPYSYNCFDNQVTATATNTYVPTTTTANPDKQLVTTLNNWVAAQTTPNDYAGWVRPTTPRINGDYPILKMPGSDAVASNGDGNVLYYGSVSGIGNLLSTYTSSSDAICLYNSVSSVTSNSSSNAEFYINEDVAIESGSDVNAHVGITLKDAAWHMFSPAIAAAPLGITYSNNTDYAYDATLPEVAFNSSDGYFPQTDLNGGNYYNSWDYYCYYEPQYHWINFKRNGNSHHHEDGNHEHINYQATPSASVNVNETSLIPAKGYLLGTKLQTFLQSEGTLNDGPVSIALTSQSPLRTGYNFIGNPYQAYLDFDAFAENSSNLNIWQGGSASNASYVILESSGYMSYVHGASDNHFGADRYLHPHQGFMVVVKNGATSASFDNNMRKMNTAAFRGEQINYPLVNLIATEADGKRDITTVELGRPDQGGALKQYDLHYGKGAIYTHYEDNDYAIAFTQPGISEVGIRFETDEDATYTLSWDTENGEFSYLHLIDNITGIDTDCLSTSEYRFTAKTSDYKSRFKLVFGYTGVEENEDGASTGSATFAFLMGNELVVNCGPSTSSGTATLQMFDLMGRMMMQRHVSGTQTSIMMPDMPTGVYVLRLSGNNGTRTQKIVME